MNHLANPIFIPCVSMCTHVPFQRIWEKNQPRISKVFGLGNFLVSKVEVCVYTTVFTIPSQSFYWLGERPCAQVELPKAALLHMD